MTRASESVVRATTVSTRAGWDAQHRHIVTTVHLRTIETLKGRLAPGTEFDVLNVGGIADGIEEQIIGAPEFIAGEEVVLFLQRDTHGNLGTVDLAQGKLEVARDNAGRARLTRRDLQAVEWAMGTGPDRVSDLTILRSRIAAVLRVAH